MAGTEFDQAIELAQQFVSKTPVIVLGSGASVAHGIPGMGPLGSHIASNPPPDLESSSDSWDHFVKALEHTDLESALTQAPLIPSHTDHVVEVTRSFLLSHDQKVLQQVIANRRCLPLSRLYSHLFRSTHETLHVVTPNYDRIAEYAADAAGFSHFTGFTYGYLNNRASDSRMRVQVRGRPLRTVCVWKVHGSLDWFKDGSGQICAIPSCTESPHGHKPVMITPGLDKYRRAYQDPFRTIIGCSDEALERATAYFCIGYGFNDEHLQPKMFERCTTHNVPVVMITKELTATAKEFLFGGVCRRFVAMEEWEGGTKIYTHEYPKGFEVAEGALWTLPQFIDYVIGK